MAIDPAATFTRKHQAPVTRTTGLDVTKRGKKVLYPGGPPGQSLVRSAPAPLECVCGPI
jgi:hypothetical protein